MTNIQAPVLARCLEDIPTPYFPTCPQPHLMGRMSCLLLLKNAVAAMCKNCKRRKDELYLTLLKYESIVCGKFPFPHKQSRCAT